MTHWVDEALDVAALVLAERSPEDAAVALCAGRPVGDGDGRLALTRERLRRCSTSLATDLGPESWKATVRRTAAMPTDEAIARTLAALRATEPAG